jgi:hypothetical protein
MLSKSVSMILFFSAMSMASATFNTWKAIYYQELKLLGYRIKKKLENEFRAWFQELV